MPVTDRVSFFNCRDVLPDLQSNVLTMNYFLIFTSGLGLLVAFFKYSPEESIEQKNLPSFEISIIIDDEGA